MFNNWKSLGIVAVLAAAGVLSTSTAEAFHRHHGSGGSSGGGWGSSGGSWGGWGSSGGGWGSSGGSSGGWHHHHHAHWGSSGGSSGGSGGGSSGGSSGGWSSGDWSHGGHDAGGATYGVPMENGAPPATPMPPMPSDAAPPAAAPPAAPPADGTTYHPAYGPARTAATVSVKVPAEAKIYVNGMATTTTGETRQYISRGLKAGARYSYEVKAEIERNGKIETETKTVQLRAGDTADLTFTLDGKKEENVVSSPVKTKVTVRLPADAKLILSGHETQSTGDLREFTTTQLQAGEVWADYTVRVEVTRNGQTLSKDQTIALNAGEDRELSFDFDTDKVANVAR